MNNQKKKEILDLYHKLGISEVNSVKYTFSHGDINGRSALNMIQKDNDKIFIKKVIIEK